MDHPELHGPHYDQTLFIRPGRLSRLHKGGDPVQVPNQPAKKGEPAQTVEMQRERDPKRKNRGFSSTILTTGLGGSSDNRTNSILGG